MQSAALTSTQPKEQISTLTIRGRREPKRSRTLSGSRPPQIAVLASNEAARTGRGKILANFREIPAPARSVAQEVIDSLEEAGIHGVHTMGNTSEPVCQIAIGMNRVGMVLLGGLNPVAAAVEAGIEIENIAESGLIEFNQLVSFWKLKA